MRRNSILAIAFAIVICAPLRGYTIFGNVASHTNLDDSDQDRDGKSAVVGTGDFNGDGIPDVVIASTDQKQPDQYSLTVQLGHSDGTFTSVESKYVKGTNPQAIVTGDFDGDGNADAIVGDEGGEVVEFLGDGRGHFLKETVVATVGSVASLAGGHFTRRGGQDLVISDSKTNSGLVLLNEGDGTFRIAWTFELPSAGTRFEIAAADFNHDGLIDLIITSEDDGNYEVMLGDGKGSFTYSPELSHLRDPNSYCPTWVQTGV